MGVDTAGFRAIVKSCGECRLDEASAKALGVHKGIDTVVYDVSCDLQRLAQGSHRGHRLTTPEELMQEFMGPCRGWAKSGATLHIFVPDAAANPLKAPTDSNRAHRAANAAASKSAEEKLAPYPRGCTLRETKTSEGSLAFHLVDAKGGQVEHGGMMSLARLMISEKRLRRELLGLFHQWMGYEKILEKAFGGCTIVSALSVNDEDAPTAYYYSETARGVEYAFCPVLFRCVEERPEADHYIGSIVSTLLDPSTRDAHGVWAYGGAELVKVKNLLVATVDHDLVLLMAYVLCDAAYREDEAEIATLCTNSRAQARHQADCKESGSSVLAELMPYRMSKHRHSTPQVFVHNMRSGPAYEMMYINGLIHGLHLCKRPVFVLLVASIVFSDDYLPRKTTRQQDLPRNQLFEDRCVSPEHAWTTLLKWYRTRADVMADGRDMAGNICEHALGVITAYWLDARAEETKAVKESFRVFVTGLHKKKNEPFMRALRLPRPGRAESRLEEGQRIFTRALRDWVYTSVRRRAELCG